MRMRFKTVSEWSVLLVQRDVPKPSPLVELNDLICTMLEAAPGSSPPATSLPYPSGS